MNCNACTSPPTHAQGWPFLWLGQNNGKTIKVSIIFHLPSFMFIEGADDATIPMLKDLKALLGRDAIGQTSIIIIISPSS